MLFQEPKEEVVTMKTVFLTALFAALTISLAFAQIGPKQSEKAKTDTTKTQKKAAEASKAAGAVEKAKAKVDEAKAQKESQTTAKPAGVVEKAKAEMDTTKMKKKAEKASEPKSKLMKAKAAADTTTKQMKKEKQEKIKSKPAETEKPKAEMKKMKPEAAAVAGHLRRALFTTAIEGHEPVGSVDSLSTGNTQVYFFTEIVGREGHTITHRWMYNGKVLAEVPIVIGGPRWRVYSSKNLLPAWTGELKVEVVDDDGSVLGSKSLTYYAAKGNE
jgi:hypothetical protein